MALIRTFRLMLLLGWFFGLPQLTCAQAPTLAFGFTGNSSGCAPHSVTFTIDGSGNPANTTYTLDFGDGSPIQNYTQATVPATVTHLYSTVSCGFNFPSQINSFGAVMTATNPQGQQVGTVTPIRIAKAPVASFSASALTICAGSSIVFNNTSDPGVTYNNAGTCLYAAPFYWDITNTANWTLTSGVMGSNQGFPNNINAWLPTSTNSITVQFNVPGTYQVTLREGNGCGITQDVKTICVLPPPVPLFSMTPTTGCIPPNLQVNTTNTTTAPAACAPITYTWNWSVSPASGWSFSPGTANSQNPGILFNTAGNYTVTLNASVNGVSSCSASISHPLNLTAAPVISVPATSVCAGGSPVQLSASPSGGTWTGPGVTAGGLFTPPASTGTVNLTYSIPASGACPAQSQTVPVTITPPPSISISPAIAAMCPGGSVVLTATSTAANTNFTWTPVTGLSPTTGATVTANPASTTTYTVTGSIGGGCSGQATRTVTVYTPPTVSVPTPAAVCPGQTVNLTATGASGQGPYNYAWSPATGLSATSGASVTATVNANATYTVTVTDNHSCTGTANVNVSTLPVPSPFAGNDQLLCVSPTPVALLGTPAGGTWSGSAFVTPGGQFTPSTAGTYTLNYTVNQGPCSVSDQVVITVSTLQPANTSGPSTLCLNSGAVQLGGTPLNGTWTGSPLVTAGGLFTPSAVGTYNLTYSVGSGTCAVSATKQIIVYPSPTVSLNDQTLCAGVAANITAVAAGGTGPYQYAWNPSSGLTGTGATVSAVLNADVSLSVTVTDVHNCTATDNAQITVLSSPQVEAGNSLIVCDTPDPITLTGFSPSGGTWSGTGVSAGGIFTPNGTGVFTLTYNFSQAGCSGSDQLQITVNAVPVPDAGLNQQVCIGSAPIALSGSPSGGMWTGTGNLTSGGTFTPDAAGTFMLHYHVGMGNCAVEDSMSIQVYDLPQLSVNDAQYCNGQSATLTASLSGTPGPYTYSWSPGTGLSTTSGASVTSTVSSSQLYTVTASDGVGCSVSAQSQVTVIPAPTVNAGSDLQICTYPLPLQLVDFSPAGGTWSGPSVTPSGIFTAAAVGSYTLTYSYSLPNGCTSTDAVVIDVALPPVLNAGPNVVVCEDAAPLQLQANLPAAWSGSPYVNNSGLFQIPVPGTYSVIATNGTGTCQVRDTLQIQVVTLPAVTVADTNTCALHPVSVTAQASGGAGGYQYTWSPPAGLNTTTGATVQAGPAATTTYTVTVSDANGCTATDQMILSTIPIPPVNVGPDISQCVSSTPIPLPAAVPNTGVWSGSGISGTDFIPSTAGVFEVYYTVTGANGCTNADTLVFSINPLPLVDAGPNLSLCLGGPSLQLTPTAPLTGTWSGGVGANGIFDPITVGSSTVYWTSGTGTCEVMDSLVITVQPLPLVNAGNDTTVCVSAAAWVLDGLPAAGGTGVWTGPGVNAGSFDPQLSGPGTFDLIYAFTQTSTGCLNRDTLQAVVIAVPQIALNPPSLQVCLSGIPSLLTASPTGGTWTASGVTLSADLQAPADSVWMLPTALGNFEAVYTFSSGSQCIARDTVSIQVIPTPQANAGNDTAFCVGQTGVQLQGLPAGGTWPAAFNPSWLGTAGQVNTTSADTAWVVYQTGTGTCLDRDSARVALFPNPVVDAGPPISACADASCINLTGASPAGGSWTGNGIMGNQFCPTMAGAGTYNLTYTASATFTYQTMSASCSANDVRVATVYALPTADFSMVSPICRNTTTVPVNLSVGGQTYTWTLIALPSNTTVATYTGSSPVIAPPDSGTYQVHLEVVSAQGCEASVTYPLQVNGPPVMQLDIPPATVCGPWPLTVNVQSSGTINQYAWDFGPLFPPSNLASPAFPVLPAPIINDTLYFVNLTVSNVCGSTSDYDSVRVRPQPVADIQTDYSQGCSPMTVVLQNISYGSPDSFDWDFGNGQSSTDSLPSSVVLTASNLPQVYVIHLDIQNTCGSASDSVAVTVFPDAISLGGIVPQIACAPYTFSFAAPVSGQTFYLWDFGDGTGSIGQQVSHEYEDAGTYALSLTVSNFCVSDTATAVMTLLEGPDLSLNLSSNALCTGSSITLNNTSTNGSQFEWLPDNGTVLPYSNPVSVSYPIAGSFSAGIAGTNTATGCRDTVYEELNVYTAPDIQVTADPDTGCTPLVAHFINTSTGANSWEWQFSNGEMSTLIEPVVQFSGIGSFSATVIARNILSNQEVCADTAVVDVWVLPTPTSTFDLAANAGCGPPASVQTINNSAAGLQYRWEWDGNVDLNFAPTLSFADTGNHAVNLIVTNEFACSDTSIRGFRVNGKPQLAWTIDPDYGCAPLEVVMHNTSTFSEAVQWNISNGMQTLGDTMAVTLSEPGFYDVQLTVSNTDGACSSDTLLVQGIRVFPNPVASFIAAQTLLSESDPVVTLLNTSSGYSTLQFEVKDEILPGLPAVYQFSEGDTGVYAMVLYAENEFGCRDTFMQQIEIDEAPVFYVPSSFSPNGDGVNDEFLIMLDREPQEFEALIYNRWGELVFRTKDPHEGWKGTKNNRDRPLVEEVYVLKLNLRFFGKDREVVYRNITVIQ